MGGEAPEPWRLTRALSIGGGDGGRVPEEMLHLVMGFVEDPHDWEAASLVCRRWHRVDVLSRKHVTVPFCYVVSPARLLTQFPRLESLAVKGKPPVQPPPTGGGDSLVLGVGRGIGAWDPDPGSAVV